MWRSDVQGLFRLYLQLPFDRFHLGDVQIGCDLGRGRARHGSCWIKNGTFAYVGGLVLYLAVTWKISSRRYEIAARSQTMFTAA